MRWILTMAMLTSACAKEAPVVQVTISEELISIGSEVRIDVHVSVGHNQICFHKDPLDSIEISASTQSKRHQEFFLQGRDSDLICISNKTQTYRMDVSAEKVSDGILLRLDDVKLLTLNEEPFTKISVTVYPALTDFWSKYGPFVDGYSSPEVAVRIGRINM